MGETMEIENENKNSLDYSALSIDLLPQYLTPLEKELLVILLNKVSNVTSAMVERDIQIAFVLNFTEHLIFDPRPYDINKILENPTVHSIFKSFLKDFGKYIRFEDPQQKKEIAEKIKKIYFTGEGRLSAEKKRHILVRAINKSFLNNIPSYMKINHMLSILEAKGLLQHSKIGKKTFWNVEPHFYQKWLNSHKQFAYDSLILKNKNYIADLVGV